MNDNDKIAPRTANVAETVPEPCLIFGTALRPFCLGHHLLFRRLGLPFADNPLADSTTEQFLQSVVICSGESYEATLNAMLERRWAKEVYQVWLERVNWRMGLTTTQLPALIVETKALFQNHLISGYQLPPVNQHVNTQGISLTAPWEQFFKCRLISAGFELTDILNGYMPERWYDYYTVLELNQAENCSSVASWKKVFFTAKDAEMMAAVDKPTETEAAKEDTAE